MKTRIPLPVATSRTADHAAQRRAADARATTPLQQMADQSGRVGLLQRLQADADGCAQRAGAEEEELLQGRFKAAQLAEAAQEDELRHEMIEAGQEAGLEEDEPVDEMSESAAVIGPEEEERRKLETAQAAGLEEEEPLQAKSERVTGSSEPVLRRVDPTTTVNGVPVNDDPALEHEADVMGAKAAQFVPEEEEPVQGKFGQVAQKTAQQANRTGLPDRLKAGIEHYSGASLNSVKVHYNSAKPAQLNALAYAQGTDIHLAPGQEQHLPHEAWHVVQQANEGSRNWKIAVYSLRGVDPRDVRRMIQRVKESDIRVRAYHLSLRRDRKNATPEENWVAAERDMTKKEILSQPGFFYPTSLLKIGELPTQWACRNWASDMLKVVLDPKSPYFTPDVDTGKIEPGWAFDLSPKLASQKKPGEFGNKTPELHLHKSSTWYVGTVKASRFDYKDPEHNPPNDMVDAAAALIKGKEHAHDN